MSPPSPGRGESSQRQNPASAPTLTTLGRPRSILPLHSPSSRANLLGWLSIDELKPLAEQGKIDRDAPLSVLMEGGADNEAVNGTGKKPVKEFKKGRKYEGVSAALRSPSRTLTRLSRNCAQSLPRRHHSKSSRRSLRGRKVREEAALSLRL